MRRPPAQARSSDRADGETCGRRPMGWPYSNGIYYILTNLKIYPVGAHTPIVSRSVTLSRGRNARRCFCSGICNDLWDHEMQLSRPTWRSC